MKKFEDRYRLIRETVKDCRLFRNIADWEIDRIISGNVGIAKQFYPGERLISEGEIITSLRIVISGRVKVSRTTKDGNEMTDRILEEKRIIGLEIISNPQYHSNYDYVAICDTLVYSIDRNILFDREIITEECFECLMMNIISMMLHDGMRKDQKLMVLSNGKLRNRIEMFLYFHYKKFGSSEFDISFSREDLADYMCANRSALSREISLMKKEGQIEVKGRHFRILDEHIMKKGDNI